MQKQGTTSIKNYFDKFIEYKDELELEINIQRKLGFTYEPFTDYELTELFMKGLSTSMQSNITREIIIKFKTTSITLSELESVLKAEIEREKYLNLLQNKSTKEVDVNYVQTRGNNDEISVLKQEINALKNKLKQKDKFRCRHGKNCRFATKCRFFHTKEELDHFNADTNNDNFRGRNCGNYRNARYRSDGGVME